MKFNINIINVFIIAYFTFDSVAFNIVPPTVTTYCLSVFFFFVFAISLSSSEPTNFVSGYVNWYDKIYYMFQLLYLLFFFLFHSIPSLVDITVLHASSLRYRLDDIRDRLQPRLLYVFYTDQVYLQTYFGYINVQSKRIPWKKVSFMPAASSTLCFLHF